ncbi:MAG: hypothetical protein HQ567_04830, partial [Candidatus Nealsonbacteria bacterium]|nr:hypothetical protein [Candidatus Nealsonbacteria bacterium]
MIRLTVFSVVLRIPQQQSKRLGATTACYCALIGAMLATATAARADIVGFNDPVGFTLNQDNAAGLPRIVGDTVTMTTALGGQATSLFYNEKQNISTFTATFDYRDVSTNGADGIAFIVQNDVRGLNALGNSGGNRGYSGVDGGDDINDSAALLLNIYLTSNVAIGMNGAVGPSGSTGSVNLRSGNTIAVTLDYDGSDLELAMAERGTANTFSTTYPGIDVQALVGGQPTAWVGFGAGTGGDTAEQTITNFVFSAHTIESLTWDGSGSGLWGQSKWIGNTPPDFPVDDATYTIGAVVNSAGQTVTVAANRSANSLEVEAGAVTVGQNNTLAISTRIDAAAITLQSGATLTAGEGGSIDQLSIGPSATLGVGGGSMSVGQLTDRGAPATLIKTGGGSLELGGPTGGVSLVSESTIEVAEGTLRSVGADPLGNAQTVRLTGGTLIVGGEPGTVTPGVPGSGLKLHLKADSLALANGAPVGTWADDSGQGHDATFGGIAAERPAYRVVSGVLDGNPYVSFDGIDDYLQNDSSWDLNSRDVTMFFVARRVDTRLAHGFFAQNKPGQADYIDTGNLSVEIQPSAIRFFNFANSLQLDSPDPGMTDFHILEAVIDGTDAKATGYFDGSLFGEDAINGDTLDPTRYLIGRRLDPDPAVNDAGRNDFAEILIFDRVLADNERGQVGLYLQDKYALDGTYSDISPGIAPVNMPDTSVIVTESSTLHAETIATAQFGPLTLQEGVLSLRGASDGMNFASMTLAPAPGATAVGLNADMDVTVDALEGGATADFVKSGPGSLVLAGPTAGMENTTVDLQGGGLTMAADLALAGLTSPRGAAIDTGGNRLIVSGDLQLGGLTYSAGAAGSFAAIGANLADSADLEVLSGTLTVTGGSGRIERTEPGSGIITANEPTGTEYDPSPGSEQKEMAFDNNINTKWLSFTNPVEFDTWIAYQFPGGNQHVINEYEVTSGNDVPARDPKNWRLEGSNNGTTWSVLDTRTDENFGTRSETRSFSFANTAEYEHYRFFIEERVGDASSTQLSEIALFSPEFADIAMDNVTMAPGTTLKLGGGVPSATIGNLTVADGTTIEGFITVENSLSMTGDGVGTLTIGDGELVFGSGATYHARVSLGSGAVIEADKIVLATDSSSLLLGGELKVSSANDRKSNTFWADTPQTIVDNSVGGAIGFLDTGGGWPVMQGHQFDTVNPALAARGDPAPHIGQGAFLRDVDYLNPFGNITVRVDLDVFVAIGGDADGDKMVWQSDFDVLDANFSRTGSGMAWTDGNFDPWVDDKVWLSDWGQLR